MITLKGIRSVWSRVVARDPEQPRADWLAALAQRSPRLYLALVIFLAALGYAYLAFFPLAALFLVLDLWAAMGAASAKSLVAIATEAALAALAGLITYQLLRTRLDLPGHNPVQPGEAPSIFRLVEELSGAYRGPTIQRICLTDCFEVEAVRTPRSAFPLLHKHTLLIGIPLLLSLSPRHVEVMLARALGRLSGRQSRLTSHLHGLQNTWYQLGAEHEVQPELGRLVLRGFFSWFAPLYAKAVVHVSHMDELEADGYALERYGDRDVLEALFAAAIVQWYLRKRFWPEIYAMSRDYREPPVMPYAEMDRAVREKLTREDAQRALNAAVEEQTDTKGAQLSLRARMEALGCDRAWLPPLGEAGAARDLLGAALAHPMEQINRKWLVEVLPGWTKRYHESREDKERFRALHEKLRSGPLVIQDALTYARLAETYLDRDKAVAAHKSLLRMNTHDAKLNFVVGRFLIARKDPAGAAALMDAMVQDEQYAVPARRLLAKFRAKHEAGQPRADRKAPVSSYRERTA
jgi:hypothetical protein